MELHFINEGDYGIQTRSFLPYISKLEAQIEVGAGDLNIIFVNDQYIQELNKAYRDKDKPTDVLSFAYSEAGLIGEVYISVATAERQAKERGHALVDELNKLIVHGILHVHGFDHEEDEDYRKMFAIEKEVLGKIAGEMIFNE
ncbi:MAG: rRNA maturation RNase YbeY [Candidatus Peregrinibacteria bacterium]|nr:rRNA maturation RNase YbeY [Candidatus Peregrinibacteria bacterium]